MKKYEKISGKSSAKILLCYNHKDFLKGAKYHGKRTFSI